MPTEGLRGDGTRADKLNGLRFTVMGKLPRKTLKYDNQSMLSNVALVFLSVSILRLVSRIL